MTFFCILETEVCLLPKKVGPCDPWPEITRYYYNHKKRECEEFIWGGCQANGNNFETSAACKEACIAYMHYFG